eukprot:gene32635-51117_t
MVCRFDRVLCGSTPEHCIDPDAPVNINVAYHPTDVGITGRHPKDAMAALSV